MATTKAVPPPATSHRAPTAIPAITPAAPPFTSANWARTRPAGGGGVAVRAPANVCIAPEMAVATAPAIARWSGSHHSSLAPGGRRSAAAAAVSHRRAAVW